MPTTDDLQTFIELRAKGVPYAAISKQLGKSKQTLINWSRDHEQDIANARAIV